MSNAKENTRIMKKIFNSILTVILVMTVALPLSAQDSRQRTVETIVGDVLAQMPTQTQADFNREMGYLAESAPKSVILLAKMLQPAEKACNNKVEYAISGVVAYATQNAKTREAVKQGIEQSISGAPDQTAKEFLQQQLRLFLTENDVEYTDHTGASPYAAEWDKLVSLGDNAGNEILKSLKSKDHAYRMQALKFATDNSLTDDVFAKKVAGKYNSCKDEGKTDILNWIGDNKIASQKPLLIKALKKGGVPSAAAVEALGKIGGDDAIDALIGQLGTENNDVAYAALAALKGDISGKVTESLSTATGDQLVSLINLSNDRRIKKASDKIFELTGNSDELTSSVAKKCLAGVVESKDISKVASMLDKADKKDIPVFQKALAACVKAQDVKEQYKTISDQMKSVSNKDRFFSTLAATGTDESVQELKTIGTAEAINALKGSKNYKAAAPLLEAAKKGDESALSSYVNLVNTYEQNADSRFNKLDEAMKIAKSTDAKKNILNSLAKTPTRSAFNLVGQYLDDKEIGYDAALAEKAILGKSMDDIEYDVVKTNMNKCIEKLKAHGSADDGYAVDEIKKTLNEMEPSPIYQLTDEEKAEGFELLFDGTNLDKFTGNKTNYVPINGAIYVTADYGSGGNLYTEKEYRDFVFRFEFCFMRPGVNNGIGVRTPMGVDAAYDGMCECQILDHDDPIYAGWLREYQVHGSVYGVIPAKRIKHKGIGEWSTEEIRVQGDHITVTVNGEVITDGDIREACQGHNVAPDGGNENPFTVDHRNHPGMFNEKGHIGFLGHGTGIKFRNVRVLDLGGSSKKAKKTSKKK